MSRGEEKLREVLTSIVEEKYPRAFDVKVKAISSAGANYSSGLYEAKIITPEENVELFAKVCYMGEAFNKECNVFATEKYIYTNISTVYSKIQNSHGLTEKRFVFPKYYKSSSANDETQIIVMENLVAKGYSCYDRFQCIDFKYASKCIETLAKYHALSLALKKEDPNEFKRAEELQLPAVVGPEWDGLTDAALAAVDEADREKLAKLLEGPGGWTKMKELGDARKTGVIIHGDYRASNLMHKETDGELHVIPVDYQTARLGCPAADLIYFLLLGTDQQFRQQHFHPLVDHYYQQLALAMTRLGLVPEEVYGREEFDGDMKEKLPLGLCTAAIGLPFVLVEAAHAPSFEKGQYVPRSNELFVERFRELVQDFKQWGYI